MTPTSQSLRATPGGKAATVNSPPPAVAANILVSLVSDNGETAADTDLFHRQQMSAADNQSHRLHKNHANSATGTRSNSARYSMGQS